jgi:chemotaxis protein MotB
MMLKFLKPTTLGAMAFIMVAGCSDQKIQTLKDAICCDGGYEYRYRDRFAAEKASSNMEARIAALERDRQRLSEELVTARKETGALSDQVKSLEGQLADRDRELASLRSGGGDSAKLAGQLSSTQGENARLAAALAASQASLSALQAGAGNKDQLGSELAAAKQRNAELEVQLATAQGLLADRDKELASLRGDLSAEMGKLKDAQRGIIRALRPQIEKGNIMVDLNNERLLINLASSYLFGSGEDQLKPAGADALKQVGAILKDFPEYKVAVDGHTDNRPIRSELKKKFPTNKELSAARAANAAMALGEGGLRAVTTNGYADTQPVMPNTTDAGRAKNRRVEGRVTK